LSPGVAPRKLLLYNEKKKPYLQVPIGPNNVRMYPQKPLSYQVEDDKGSKYVVTMKNLADQVKFGVHLSVARSMHWPDAAGTAIISQDLVLGTGRAVGAGDTVTVRFMAWDEAEGADSRGVIGKMFDGNASEDSEPLKFAVGRGSVLKGLDEGVVGMCVGGMRRLVVPPSKGYGAAGVPGRVVPNSVVHLELTVLECVAGGGGRPRAPPPTRTRRAAAGAHWRGPCRRLSSTSLTCVSSRSARGPTRSTQCYALRHTMRPVTLVLFSCRRAPLSARCSSMTRTSTRSCRPPSGTA